DFLNMYFQNMYKPIPLVYNLALAMLWRHQENVDLDIVKFLHYCAAREDIKKLVSKWWEIYNDESLDFRLGERRKNAESRSELQQITANALRGEMAKP
ncbi:hypothetical protein KI387_032604, partial [Taxus chinensis]